MKDRHAAVTLCSNMLGREFPLSILESPFCSTHTYNAHAHAGSEQYHHIIEGWDIFEREAFENGQTVPEDLQEGKNEREGIKKY